LDNVVYRLGFVTTRPAARQLVSHRHVFVNGKRVNIPSYQVKIGDTITLSAKSLETPTVKKQLGEKSVKIPGWLERKGPAGKVAKEPVSEDIAEQVSAQDIVEFYSR
jgi:small subunit ribosomal protein S4